MSIPVVSWRMPSATGLAGWTPKWVETMLVLAMAWVVSGWFASGFTPSPPSPHAGSLPPSMTLPATDEIAAVPLFGTPIFASQHDAAPVVASHLSIRLWGTVVAGPHSVAVLALRPGADQQVFMLGQYLEPGVVLKAVEPEAIVVDNHGHLERVAMPRPELVLAPSSSGGASHMEISRAGLDAQLQHLPRLLTQARASQHRVAGRSDGIMIDDIVPGSLYAKVGLRDGDVIRSVNGQPLMRMDQGIRMFRSMRHQRHVDLAITRGGAIRHLHYSIR